MYIYIFSRVLVFFLSWWQGLTKLQLTLSTKDLTTILMSTDQQWGSKEWYQTAPGKIHLNGADPGYLQRHVREAQGMSSVLGRRDTPQVCAHQQSWFGWLPSSKGSCMTGYLNKRFLQPKRQHSHLSVPLQDISLPPSLLSFTKGMELFSLFSTALIQLSLWRFPPQTSQQQEYWKAASRWWRLCIIQRSPNHAAHL